jgi:uncharacterized membrane protein YozB (DUF420 family)
VTDLFHRPGFFGTSANWAADMTLLLSILVAVMFTIGVAMALRQRYEVHRWLQTAAAVLNIILVLWLMVLPYRDFVAPGIPQQLDKRFYWVTTLHAVVGFFAFTFGNFVVLRGNGLMIQSLKFNNYKPFMRVAYALYMITTLLGILVYFVWFVNNPNPPIYE